MASVFDGLAGVLNDVFGAPVTVSGSVSATVRGIFRETPLEQDLGDGRGIFTVAPTVKIRRGDTAQLVKGDLVAPSESSGRTFVVLQAVASGSPAADAFVTYLLEEVRE